MTENVSWAVSPSAVNATLMVNAAVVGAAGPLTLLVNDTSVNTCGYKILFTAAAAATVTGVAITGTAGQFSCTGTTLTVGEALTISGTYGGTGSITGYSNPTTYYIIATNGTTTFQLSLTRGGAAITTTAGTPTGLTYTLNNTGATFTIVGNTVGQPTGQVTEVVSAPTGTTATSTNYWAQIVSITASTALAGALSVGITGSLALPRCRIRGLSVVAAATAGSVAVTMNTSGKVILNIDTPASTAFSSYIDLDQMLVAAASAADFGVVTLTQVTKCTFICG